MKSTVFTFALMLFALSLLAQKSELRKIQKLSQSSYSNLEARRSILSIIDTTTQEYSKLRNEPKLWKIKGDIEKQYEDYLLESYQSYKKALSLDKKEKYHEDIINTLTDASYCVLFYDLANKAYSQNRYLLQAKYYKALLDMNLYLSNDSSRKDSSLFFNTAQCYIDYFFQNYIDVTSQDTLTKYIDLAQKCYQKSISINYKPLESYEKIIKTYSLGNRAYSIDKLVEEAIVKYPGEPQILNHLTDVYNPIEDSVKLMSLYKKSLDKLQDRAKVDPNDVEVRFLIANVNYFIYTLAHTSKSFKKARDIYQSFLADPIYHSAAISSLAYLYSHKGFYLNLEADKLWTVVSKGLINKYVKLEFIGIKYNSRLIEYDVFDEQLLPKDPKLIEYGILKRDEKKAFVKAHDYLNLYLNSSEESKNDANAIHCMIKICRRLGLTSEYYDMINRKVRLNYQN